ncbi:MAG: N-6 DNA methylase [Bacteroidetes bacterium]|nr:N-6 DNA methylase [Bacteroidota bacterium]
MALFQKSVLRKHLNEQDKHLVAEAFAKFSAHFGSAAIQQNICDAKEEEYQEGFVRDLFVNVLGYTLKPQPEYNFVLEKKNATDSKKADGAVMKGEAVHAVVELKGTDTVDLDHVETQAFGYKNNQKGCAYVITSNFEKLRFYIEDSVEHLEFDLFHLSADDFAVLYLCLHKDNLLANLPATIKSASVNQEQGITKKLYNDYSNFKRQLYHNIHTLNPGFDKLVVYKKTQKLLDRFLFILFAEDKQLLPPNSIREILKQWEQLKELDEVVPLYERYKKYFGYLNTGHKGKQHDIFAYNGGLFAPDEVLDNITIDDTLLYDSTFALSQYDFETEVDVNILGHIFEHSLNDVDAVAAEAEGKQLEKDKTRRKKDGVFYTPKYITKYIVENTVGKLCDEKKAALEIKDEDYSGGKKKKDKRALNDKLESYRQWLLQLTILDPACGSGAFLNQALEFLIAEHRKVDELRAKLFEDSITLTDVENHILENNLYGVDLNEESIEIAKLSLWLRTAKKGRKLSALNHNIKCGNSLIDDPAVAGDKAFKWEKEFAECL